MRPRRIDKPSVGSLGAFRRRHLGQRDGHFLHPDRVVALFLRSGTVTMFHLRHREFTDIPVPEAVYSIRPWSTPARRKSRQRRVPRQRRHVPGLPREGRPLSAWPSIRAPATSAATADTWPIPFLDLCMSIRLPDRGGKDQTLKPMDTIHAWLAPLEGEHRRARVPVPGRPQHFQSGCPTKPSPGPGWNTPRLGAVGDTTPPSAPFNVNANAHAAGQGTEVTWSAEADFESGIGQFIILRDGKELARVPRSPRTDSDVPCFKA